MEDGPVPLGRLLNFPYYKVNLLTRDLLCIFSLKSNFVSSQVHLHT